MTGSHARKLSRNKPDAFHASRKFGCRSVNNGVNRPLRFKRYCDANMTTEMDEVGVRIVTQIGVSFRSAPAGRNRWLRFGLE